MPIVVYTTPSLLYVYGWQFYPGTVAGGYRPTGVATIDVVIPAQTASAQLAVGTLAMSFSNAGLGASTPLTYDDSACCNGGAQDRVEAGTFSRSVIAHETGHGVYRRRDGQLTTTEDQSSALDGCDGENNGQTGHTNTTKEWYSSAIKEGLADFYAAWLWNDATSDCDYDRHYGTDFDLNGVGFVDQYSCENVPLTGLASYVSGDDWLEDLVNASDPAGCSGTLSHRSTQYDVLRYLWDLYTDQSVPFSAIVDIVDDADPHDWNATHDALNPNDDPEKRWADAALANRRRPQRDGPLTPAALLVGWGSLAGCHRFRVDIPPTTRVWTGTHAFDVAGRTVDVGVLDEGSPERILTGTPNEAHRLTPGAAFLVGADTPEGRLTLVADATFLGTTSSWFGDDVAFAGDLTGDGLPDVVVAGQDESVPTADFAATVYSHPADGVVPTSAGWLRIAYDDLQPNTVTTCGDLDGDGAPELCLGSTPGLHATRTGVGVYFGPLPQGEVAFADVPTLLTAEPGSWAGAHGLEGGSDVDGDGLADLVVGAFGMDADRGAMFVVSAPGPGETPLDAFPRWDGIAGAGSEAGVGVAVGGDLDGDGANDVFVGAHLGDERRGFSYVVTDKDGGPLAASHASIEGDRASDWLGIDGAIGDLDGDGTADLAIGVPRDIYFGFDRPGRVAVFLGPIPAGTQRVADADLVVSGSRDPDAFGLDLDIGDVDGDGRADLVVGAPYDNSAGESVGRVYLFGGPALFP